MKKAIESIRAEDATELKAKLNDLRKEQWKLRFRGAPEEVNKTSRHREVRRTIARILMVLGDRDRAAASPASGGKVAAAKAAAAKVPAAKAAAAKPPAAKAAPKKGTKS